MVTEVTPEGKIFAQHFDEGPKLEALMNEIRQEFTANPPLAGAYQPKRGERYPGNLFLFSQSLARIFLHFPSV